LLLGKIHLTQVMINGRVPWTTNTTPGGFDEQWFQKGGSRGRWLLLLKVRSDEAPENLDGLKKRLWRLEAIVMASTLTIVAAAAGLFLRCFSWHGRVLVCLALFAHLFQSGLFKDYDTPIRLYFYRVPR
jgi:hypothetical protein